MKGAVSMTMDLKPLKRLARKSPQLFNEAMQKGAIQFLTWANNGSPQESRKPPIRWGVLRASGSAFVGSKLVAVAPQTYSSTGDEKPEPIRSYTESPTTITWIWNTPYAARMHEHTGNWGPYTTQDTDAGNKWLEKHLQADKEALMDMIEKEFWKASKGL